MKTLKCDLCEHTTSGETFDEWMKALQPHYMEAHADVMKNKAHLSPEGQKNEMDKWMAENKARFDSIE